MIRKPEEVKFDTTKVGTVPVESPIPHTVAPEPTPGFFESLSISAGLSSDIPAAVKYVGKIGDRLKWMTTEAPKGWTPFAEDYSGVPNEYLGNLFDSGTPSEFYSKKKDILSEIKTREYLASGSAFGSVVGTGLGALFSLSTAIPIAAGAKYAKVTEGIIKNMGMQAPGIAAQAMARNTLINMASETRDLKDWAHDSIIETAFALPIVGALGARGAYKIQAGKSGLKEKLDGVDILTEANVDGTFKTYKAVDGGSAGAMAVSRAQKRIDEGLAKYAESTIFRKIFGASPVVRGLTSKFGTVAEWTNDVFAHNLLTGKIVGGQNQLPSAEAAVKYWWARTDRAHSQVANLWAEHVGLSGPLKDVRAKLSPDTMLRSEFEEQISFAMRRGDVHEIPAVQEAAKITRKVYDDLYGELVRLEALPPNLTPTTAISYMNRVYNKAKMAENPDAWIQAVCQGMRDQNKRLREYRAPLEQINREINETRSLYNALDKKAPERKMSFERLTELKAKRDSIQESLQKMADNGEIDISLLEGRPIFSPKEMVEFKELKKPFTEIEEKLSALKKERKSVTDKEKRKEIKESIEKEKLNLKAIQEKLAEDYLDRKINQDFARVVKGGHIRLINIDKRPFLRTPTPDDKLPQVAKSVYDTIMQENEEQMVARMFGGVKNGGTNPLKSRTLMVPDSVVEPFLENNAMTLLKIHAGHVGKYVGMEDVFRKYGSTSKDGMQVIASNLEKDFQKLSAPKTEIELEKLKKDFEKSSEGKTGKELEKLQKDFKKLSEPKTEKELAELRKEYEEALDFINTTHEIYWGNYTPGAISGKTGQKISSGLRALRNYDAGSMLGNLPLLQPIELFANVMRHGVWPVIEDGILPLLSGAARKMSREEAADAGVALNTATNSYMNQMWGNGSQYLPKTGIERATQNIAAFSMNAAGVNQIADFLETMTSRISASRSMRGIKALAKGETLSEKELIRLSELGLNNPDLAKRIVSQFERYGETVSEGGTEAFLSNYHLWDDFKASQAMVLAVQKETRATILKPNLLDIPFAFRNDFIASMTQFMSYSFAATNSFLIPLLQRPDGNKLIGLMMMISAGAMTPVMRQISRGEEPDLRPEHLLYEGVINSGAGGYLTDIVTKLNSAFEIPFLKDYKPDRFKNKSASDLLAGPIGGMLNNAQQVSSMFLSGQINESGMKRMNYMLPSVFHNWYTTYLTNSMVEGLELPKTRQEARKWFEE